MPLFDAYARHYDDWYSTPRGRLAWELEWRCLQKLLSLRPGEKVLDAGCGTGIVSRALAADGAEVTGIDISPAMLAVAREKSAGTDITYLEGDITSLPFPDASYDAVVCFTTLEFVAEPERALEEMWRVLKPGGRLIVGVLNRQSSWARRRKGKGIFAYAHFYSAEELERLIRKLNPRRVKWQGVVYFPPELPSWLFFLVPLFEFLGRLLFRPLAAVLIFRAEK
ncbi:class I SAM-dependent methyltransferase [Ammonifex thiophilus]|uniref:Methyltransferase domain-containing protein n=1 Tax=Ammonifex thiophilus TaxID=444093 RepID=A0A3D8P446_9THEO|nr:class I SAM-dependent methyltransferase [Ammonifex thiophilus]RDV82863.1 methyltransferase domain-containing protein [Ammonifex thiophilus]